MADVFISYDHADRAIAERIASGLISGGFSVWWDRHIQAGVRFSKEIDRQIDAARAVIVLWSAASKDSDYVHDEAQVARDANKLIPVRVDDTLPPLGFRQVQSLDMKGWNGEPNDGAFLALVSALRPTLGGAKTEGVNESRPPIRRNPTKIWFVAGLVVVIAALGFFVVQSRVGSRTTMDAENGRIEIGKFESMGKSDELERFAKEIAGTLVRVFATGGIPTIASDGVDPRRDHALRGGTEFELRGRVDREGDELVASADIVNRGDGLVLWSTTMRRSLDESRDLQEQFSFAAGRTMACALFDRKADPYQSTELLVRHLRVCDALQSGDIERLPELAHQLIEGAPQSALAYADEALANALVSIAQTVGGADRPPAELARLREVVYNSADAAADKDPRFDPAFARAIVVDPELSLARREQFLKQDDQSFPRNWRSGSLWFYATLLESVGRIHDARAHLERAASLDPFNFSAHTESAFLAGWLGNIEAARDRFKGLRGRAPAFAVDYMRLFTELWFGDPAIAKSIRAQINTQGLKNSPIDWSCATGIVEVSASHTQLSEAEIEAACATSFKWASLGYFGYVDATFRTIEPQRADRINFEIPNLFMPQLRAVRADPRFMPLAARLGFVDYWLDTDQWPDFCREEKLPYDCKEAALAARAANNSVKAQSASTPP